MAVAIMSITGSVLVCGVSKSESELVDVPRQKK
jgi:hypothetical protein